VVLNRTVPVPVGGWFKFEFFLHRSNGADGRVWVAVNGNVIADHYGPNMGAWNLPINRIMTPILYTGSRMPVYQWIDDLEIWDGFPPVTPAPTVALSAAPINITVGQSATLSWSSSAATSCTASGGWSGAKAISGSEAITPSATTTYTLSCAGAGGATAQSTTVSVTTLPLPDTTAPSAPTGLLASAVSSSQINLSWTASTDNVGVTGYRVYRAGALLATVGAVTGYQNTGLTASTTYSYTVQAFDAAGNTSVQSASAIATTQTAPDTQAPSVPTGLTGTAISPTQINLTWNASTDNVGVTGYAVYLNNVALATTTATSFQHTGLTPGTTYNYRVSAHDAVPNYSAWTATPVSVKTPARRVVRSDFNGALRRTSLPGLVIVMTMHHRQSISC
jgi:chitodextrinase